MSQQAMTRRGFLKLSVAAAAGAVVAACQPSTPAGGGQPPEVKPTEVPVEATVPAEATAVPAGPKSVSLLFYWLTGDMTWVDRNKPLMERFQQENPGYTVEQLFPPSGMSWIEKFQAMIAAGEPPDLADTGMDQYSFADRGVFRDLQPLIDRDGVDVSDEDPIAMKSFYHRGKNLQFGFPHSMNSEPICWFNRDLFDAEGVPYPPQSWDDASWTWEAYVDLAKRMTKDTNGDGKPDQWGGAAPMYYYNAPYIFGGDWANADQTEVLVNKPEAVKGFQIYEDAMYKDKYAPTPEAQQLLQSGFMSGRMAMGFGGTWDVAGFRTIKDFKWNAAPCPRDSARPADAPRGNHVFPDALVMSSVKQVEETWTLFKWMLVNKTNHLEWSWKVLGMFPARKSLLPDYMALAQKDLPDLKWDVLADSWTHGNYCFIFLNANYSEIDSFIRANIWDQLTTNAMTAQQAIDQAMPELTQLIVGGATGQ